jgi:lipoprotein NlpD
VSLVEFAQCRRVAARTAGVIVAALLLLEGCGGPYRKPDSNTYTVRAGDTLYSIAWRHSVDYRELARWNKLSADYRIYPGQVLKLGPSGASRTAKKQTRSTSTSGALAARPPTPSPADNVTAWTWPTEGSATAVRHAPTGSHGITITGREGQTIRAAARGKVVYTGSGLRGFGQLIIVKHSDVFLSAYGHNRLLRVREGDEVLLGQPIAEMGIGPDRVPMVYFEIRYNGKPVDPRLYLPQRSAGRM